ncbi:hypothetical protein [Arthrobacter woluwensis]|uniref:Lipoprotein n=1 Tax=Arthrobacter woluwensis TaxID=156980 RepID=A0A1H4I7X5_9MICC|nr:hypothetical protein [Arthrobacter woluwensis]SEB30157.1 hypothetical protein SAMN04489745_0115 [Arthrobacter woluwensis]
MPRKSRHLALLVPVLTGALFLGACGSTTGPAQADETPTTGAPAASTSTPTKNAPSATASPTTKAPYPAGQVHTAPPQPNMGSEKVQVLTWDAKAKKQAADNATWAVFALVQGKSSAERIANAKEYLTSEAYAVWSRAELMKLPSHKVTDWGKLATGWEQNPYWVWVNVPTDAGTWKVRLHRTAANPTWLASELQPPLNGH